MAIIDVARQAAQVALDPGADEERLKTAVQEFFSALQAQRPGREEAAAAMGALSEGIASPDAGKAAFVAMCCGALVERGLPGEPMAKTLLERLAKVAASARAAYESTGLRAAEKDPEELGKAMEQLEAKNSDALREVMAIDEFFPPAIALFSVSAAARAQAASLLALIEPLSDVGQGAGWIAKILKVLHNEPYVALEPATGKGIMGKMSGVSENFQLHVLLMDIFPKSGLLAKRRVDKDIAAIARGEGPQVAGKRVTGFWNLYTWRAVRADGTLPDAKERGDASKNWIWGEGIPLDIPVFEGRRVILLGPPAYERSWNAQRDFEALKAELTIEQALKAGDVKQWLQRMAQAKSE